MQPTRHFFLGFAVTPVARSYQLAVLRDAKSLAAVSLQDKCQTLVFFSAFVRRTEVTRELVLTEIELETVDSIKNTKCPTAMGRVTVACSHAGEKAACIPQRFCFGFQCYDQRH